jgi:prolyl oligopeptidase
MHLSIDRRCLLAGAGAAAMVPMGAFAASRATASLKPPVARIEVAHDTYFGETLADPYRWMENDKDPEWLPFLKGQNAYARSILDKLPGRDALLSRISQLTGDTVATARVQQAGARLFFQQRPKGADNFKLFVREPAAAPMAGSPTTYRDRVLVDPTALSSAGVGHYSLDWWRASPDGSHLVYGISKDGSEDSIAHIMTVADGTDLGELIPNTQAAGPAWLEDGSGFFYNQLTGAVDTPERFLDSQARFHRLGTDPSSDPILMKRGLDPAVVYDNIQAPYIGVSQGSDRAILILGDVRPEARMLIAPLADVLAGKARWVQFCDFEDEVTAVEVDGDDLYLLANKGAPRGRILKTKTSTPSLASAVVVVPQGPLVIEGLNRAADGFYLEIMDGGVSRLRRLDRQGQVTDIALPFDGTIGGIFAEPDRLGVLMNLSGWLSPTAVWSVDPAGKVADTGITPKPGIDVSAYETKRMFATAKDGVKIPYTVAYRKGLKLTGTAPTFIQAYGSYGSAAYTPSFLGKYLAFIDQGGIIGFANVRGGGEYGREWHKAGQHANKPNTWRDLIAVCEDLIAQKYTSKAHLAIGGRSAGGITVGRALTERPDLFAAVIDGVGWSNPLRYVVEQNGYGEEPEWGAIADPEGYRWLKAIDSYQAVKDGTKYPAVLLTTGVTDPRVAPFHVGKMTARLQHASNSGKPILLRVDFDAGHGIGSTRSQADREAADTYAFILWRTR